MTMRWHLLLAFRASIRRGGQRSPKALKPSIYFVATDLNYFLHQQQSHFRCIVAVWLYRKEAIHILLVQ